MAMPGTRRHGRPKGEMLQVRVGPEDLARWRAHVARAGGYLSVLVRRAVDEHVTAHHKSKAPPRLYDWLRLP